MILWDFIQVTRIVRLAHARALSEGLGEKASLLARAEALSQPIEDIKRQILLLQTASHCDIYPSTIDLVVETLIRAEYAQARYLEEAAKL